MKSCLHAYCLPATLQYLHNTIRVGDRIFWEWEGFFYLICYRGDWYWSPILLWFMVYFSIPKKSNKKLWIQLLYKKYDTWSADVNTLIVYHYIHLILQKFYFSPLDNLLVSLVLTLLYVLPTLSSETSIKIQNVGNQSKQK